MTPLAPTVHERLARFGTTIHVDGLAGGLTELFVVHTDGTRTSYEYNGPDSAHDFVVAPLSAHETVVARQTLGTETTPESPPVVVEDCLYPPDTSPRLPESVDPCAHCRGVEGNVPGAEVKISVDGAFAGSGIAGSDGSLCIRVAPPVAGESYEGRLLAAQMLLNGRAGPERQVSFSSPQVKRRAPPYVGALVECQASVPLGGLTPGAQVIIETEGNEALGHFENCWTSVDVWGVRPLRPTERVWAKQVWQRGNACDDRDDPFGPSTEVSPLTEELLRPVVREALVEGNDTLRISGQVAGAMLVVHITRGDASINFGPRPASDREEVALNRALRAGEVVTVTQELCGRRATSEAVTVQRLARLPPPPVIQPPLWECGAAVRVSNLEAGAFVRIYQEGFPIGAAWAGIEPSIAVVVSPSLRADAPVVAKQFVGTKESEPSVAVNPGRLAQALEPRILEPIAGGESEVWLSHVAPGSIVTVRSGGMVIGEIAAAESVIRVPVTFVPFGVPISASARLCGSPRRSNNTVDPILDPGSPGTLSVPVRQRFKVYETRLILPAEETLDPEGGLETPLQGLWYEPDGWSETQLAELPLVVIAHGHKEFDYEMSDVNDWRRPFRGYVYLAEHLVSWGMRVFSLDLVAVNALTYGRQLRQGGRAMLILRALQAIADDEYSPPRRGNSIMRSALIGHSMGGEAVVIARNRSERRSSPIPIKGVVSIAPTYWRRAEFPYQGSYLQLIGSRDSLLRDVERFPVFHVYDRGAREKTHYWIYGARHNAFNRSWLAVYDTHENYGASAGLDPQTATSPRVDGLVEREADLVVGHTHERLAKALITPFLLKALGLPTPEQAAAYAPYLNGAILPPSIRDVVVHSEYSGGTRDDTMLVDNFGDADVMLDVAYAGIDKTKNSMGYEARAEGSRSWEDASHVFLRPNVDTPHATISTRIQWEDGAPEYRTQLVLREAPNRNGVLSLRVGQAAGTGVTLNPVARPLDFFVALRDQRGVEAVVRLGAVAPAPFRDRDICPMRTVRIPIDAFTAVAPDLALHRLEAITFRFTARRTGDVFIDDIEFTV